MKYAVSYRKNYGQVISIDMLAELIFLSPNYLRTIFKDITGKTLLEYVTQIRMDNACIMLQETNIRIHEIAKRVGLKAPLISARSFSSARGSPLTNTVRTRKRDPKHEYAEKAFQKFISVAEAAAHVSYRNDHPSYYSLPFSSMIVRSNGYWN